MYTQSLPHRLIEHVFGEGDTQGITIALRKLYSIAAFTLVGFVLDRALPPTRRPALRAALLVAAISALIEIAQKLHHAPEGPLSNAVDILCGALGGYLGALSPPARSQLGARRRVNRRGASLVGTVCRAKSRSGECTSRLLGPPARTIGAAAQAEQLPSLLLRQSGRHTARPTRKTRAPAARQTADRPGTVVRFSYGSVPHGSSFACPSRMCLRGSREYS